jgi:Flp pilus assembly protein TadG
MRGPERAAARRSESGAAAVEFALVSGVLFVVLFGILQYGLYFNDSLNTRQGVRESARQAAVENFAFATGCTTGTTADQLLCSAHKRIGSTISTPKVKVKAASWTKGSPVTICAMESANPLGVLPMPHSGWIYTKTEMSIEQVAKAATWPAGGAQDAPGTGQDWSWC